MRRVGNHLFLFIMLVAGLLAAVQSPAAAGVTPAFQSDIPPITVRAGESYTLQTVLSGGDSPTGSISHRLYVGDSCGGSPLKQVSVAVNGNGPYTLPSMTPGSVSSYSARTLYGGDANNNPVGGVCNAFAVVRALPKLTSTLDTGSKVVGTTVTGTVNAVNGFDKTGTFNFWLYGPDDPNCQSTAVAFSGSAYAQATETMTQTISFVLPAVGTYHWEASYLGDGNNIAANLPCGNAITVTQAAPVLTGTFTTGTVAAGGTATGSYNLAGGFKRKGLVKMGLYPPTNPGCLGDGMNFVKVNLDASSDALDPVTGSFTSGALFTPGTYRWAASYEGDANNAAASIACGVNFFTIPKATPTLTAQSNPDTVSIGGSAQDIAFITSAQTLTQPVTFKLYNNETCTGTPISTSSDGILTAQAVSALATPTAPGVYHWVASYPGDDQNEPVATDCLAATQKLTVLGKNAALTATPNSSQLQRGNTTSMLARVDKNATGTMTFDLYGPGDTACTGTPIAHEVVTMKKGLPTYRSTPVRLTTTGTYRWRVKYSGDGAFAAAASACSASPVTVR